MSVLHIDEKSFEKEVKKSDLPVIIDFFANWCGPCQMMGPVFEKLSKDFDKKIKFVKVDTDESPEIAGKFSVMSIPTLVILNKGKEVDRVIGFQSELSLKQKLNKVL